MPSSTRTTLALVVLVLVGGAGCLDTAPTGTPTTTGTPTPTASPSPASPTANGTPAGTEYASDRPDPSHAITLTNRWNRSVEVRVTVTREATNETVHEATYDLAAGDEEIVYDTAEASPDGIERFTVTASARNATESVTIETSRCYGNVYVEITDEGELYPYYAIC